MITSFVSGCSFMKFSSCSSRPFPILLAAVAKCRLAVSATPYIILFKLETVEGIDFKINVQKPPRSKQWECSVSFDGKSTAEFNADMCLFLEQWEDERSELRAYNSTQAAYKRWKEQTLAYYAANAVKCTEPEELDRDERIAKRTEFLEKEYGKSESNE